ncbi:hypothetical protein [Rheinheimera baltica]|uniref:hypothetical protein n=1 Tax=Rheinheimera baltica TaxID=67576 RepID=UPI0003FA1DEF|nr:hypothetical protein [Rheinheimera baltica]
MTQPVTVYRWDDPGAPQIGNGRASDIIDIWQKCLVDGYGTQLPLGWTRPFYDAVNQRAVYRNIVADGGSGGYAILYSNTANDAEYNLMRLTHAKSMVDIDTPIGQGAIKAFQVQSATGNRQFTKWVLIGTSIGFFFIITRNNMPMGGSADYNPSMYVGDLFSSTPNDAGRFITDTGQSGPADTTGVGFLSTLDYLSTNGSVGGAKIWGSDNSNVSASYNFYSLGYYQASTNRNSSPVTPQMLGPCYYAKSQLGTGFGVYDAAYDPVSPGFRGFMPGLHHCINHYSFELTWPQIITHAGNDFWMMRSVQGSPAVLLQLGAWHDPFV